MELCSNKKMLKDLANGALMTKVENDFEILNPNILEFLLYDKQSFREANAYHMGLDMGHEEGEKQKAINIASNLIKLKTSLEIIKQATGLSMEVLKDLVTKILQST